MARNPAKYVERAKELAAFYANTGRLPSIYSDDSSETRISNWRYTQVSSYKRGTIPTDRLAILNEVCPFIFDNYKEHKTWAMSLDELQAFIQNNLRIPNAKSKDANEAALKRWLQHNIRLYKDGTLQSHRLEQLKSIVPQYFGGNVNDSLLYTLAHVELGGDYAGLTLNQKARLKPLGIDTLEQVVELVESEILNGNVQSGQSGLNAPVLDILGLHMGNRNGTIIFEPNNRYKVRISTKLTEMLYQSDISVIKLIADIFEGDGGATRRVFDNANKYLEALIGTLDKRTMTIVKAMVYDKETLKSIGTRFGISKARVERVKDAAIRTLQIPCRLNVLKYGNVHWLLSNTIPVEHLTRVLVSFEYTQHRELIENMAADIRREYRCTCSTSNILGLEYFGLLKKGMDIDGAMQRIKRLAAQSAENSATYAAVFEQDTGSDYIIRTESIEVFRGIVRGKLRHDIENTVKFTANTHVSELNLPPMILNALDKVGCTKVGDLKAAVDSGNLVKTNRIGNVSYTYIVNKLKELSYD